jgi:MFS family permease
LGPVAGGIITQALGWEWAFFMNIPVGLALIFIVLRAVPESRDPDAERVDVVGFLLFSSGVFALTLALISGGAQGWSSSSVLTAFESSAALLTGFLIAQALQSRPMIDLHLFGRPTFLGANIAALAFAVTLLTMLTYLPIYFQSGLGFYPRQAGLLMLPLVVSLVLVPGLVGARLAHRLSGRALLTIGLALTSLGLLLLAVFVPAFRYTPLIGGLLLTGVGGGILNSEVVDVGMIVIPPERAGMASGISGTVRFAGIVIGFATLGAVLAGRIKAVLEQGLDRLGPAILGSNLDIPTLERSIVVGNLPGALSRAPDAVRGFLQPLVLTSFGEGYRAILLAAAAFAAFSALLTWIFVRPTDTAPLALSVIDGRRGRYSSGVSHRTDWLINEGG